jgi:hemerythrin-like metal-binding protein
MRSISPLLDWTLALLSFGLAAALFRRVRGGPPGGGSRAECRRLRIRTRELEASLARRTEELHASGRRRERQKAEAAGILAGGLAHDFNNLLSAMIGNLELVQQEAGPEAPARPYLDNLETLITRAGVLVGQLLAYAGKGKFQVQCLDLNRQVEEMLRILRASLSGKAALRWQPAPDLPAMAGDASQVQRVVANLVLNAAEAVEQKGGGMVTVRTACEELDEDRLVRECKDQGLVPGTHLVLEVADTGPGMPPEVQERVFEPFFTTKFTGRGLGLAAVQGILRSHQGGIQIRSGLGQGTTVRIYFPAAPNARARPRDRGEAQAPPRRPEFRGTGTVLVVEDEDLVRAVAVGAFRRMGFEALEARDGQEALAVHAANRDRIRLVLMDFTMPVMDGGEAYRELRERGARIPVVFTSGFGRDEALLRLQCKGLAGFLPKPYRHWTLVEVVRSALARERPPGETGEPPARNEIAWNPEWDTGHALLDAQHRVVIQSYNRLAEALARGDPEQALVGLLDELVSLLRAHYGLEERVMAQAGYPGLGAHQACHARLAAQMDPLPGQVRRRELKLTPALLDFIEAVVFFHVHREDLDLAVFLRRTGLDRVRAAPP